MFGLRSFCPKCKKGIAWYDNIPIVSWLFLFGKCRKCKKQISALYPFVEVITAVTLWTLIYIPINNHLAYFIFFSALIVSIRTDLETMLISRYVTIFLIPVGFLFSFLGLLPITLLNSIAGTILGYGSLYLTSKTFFWLTGKEGIGQGDLELLAFVGSFVGFAGCWVSLFIGAILGSISGILYITLFNKSKDIRIPFGPFLSIGAIIYVLFQEKLLYFLLGL